MGGLAPGQLKSRRGWHSSPRRLHYRFSFFDRVSRTHCGKNSINFAGMAHSHRHRLAAAWPSLVRQIGPVLRRRRHAAGAGPGHAALGPADGALAPPGDAPRSSWSALISVTISNMVHGPTVQRSDPGTRIIYVRSEGHD